MLRGKTLPRGAASVLNPASQASALPGEKECPSCSHADGDDKKIRVCSRVRMPRLLADGEMHFSTSCSGPVRSGRESSENAALTTPNGGLRWEMGRGQSSKLVVVCLPEDPAYSTWVPTFGGT